MTEKNQNPFNIIRHWGEPQKAEFEGVTVYRKEALFIPEWGSMIRCAPYDNNFIFEIPPNRKHYPHDVKDEYGKVIIRRGAPIIRSDYMCTCGGVGVVANPGAGQGQMLVCLVHQTYGHHTNEVINKEDFQKKDLGGLIDLKGNKWV